MQTLSKTQLKNEIARVQAIIDAQRAAMKEDETAVDVVAERKAKAAARDALKAAKESLTDG